MKKESKKNSESNDEIIDYYKTEINFSEIKAILYQILYFDQVKLPNGFKEFAKAEKNKVGYSGLAFQNSNNSKIYVIHTGSISSTDLSYIQNSLKDDLSDNILKLTPSLVDKALAAQIFLNQIKNKAPNAEMIQLGRGLDGTIAEICYKLSNNSIKTYCIDSVGAVEIAKSYDLYIDNEEINQPIIYFLSGPNPVNTLLEHVDNGNKNAIFYNIWPIESQEIEAISVDEYFKVTMDAYFNVLKSDKIVIYPILRDKWPVGIKSAVKYFYSDDNKPLLSILLNKKWNAICDKLQSITNKEEAFDKFFEYFSNNYLKPAENYWNNIAVDSPIEDKSFFSTYIKNPFFNPITYPKSALSYWKSYKYIDNSLVSDYVKYVTAQENNRNFIYNTFYKLLNMPFDRLNNAYSFYKNIKIATSSILNPSKDIYSLSKHYKSKAGDNNVTNNKKGKNSTQEIDNFDIIQTPKHSKYDEFLHSKFLLESKHVIGNVYTNDSFGPLDTNKIIEDLNF